ncbi:MAG: 2-oxoglutarate dehydrogenase E1 component [Alphaproteobacteria bacterium]
MKHLGEYLGESAWLYGSNETYLAELLEKWRDNPQSVDPYFQEVFAGLTADSDEEADNIEDHKGPSWARRDTAIIDAPLEDEFDEKQTGGINQRLINQLLKGLGTNAEAGIPADRIRQATLDSIRALMLIRAYRMRGHMIATLDPLELIERDDHPELDYKNFGFHEADLDRPIFINFYLGLESASLREILDICKKTYCGNIGVEYMHIQTPEEKSWIQEQVEASLNQKDFTNLGRRTILERLTRADVFETYLDKKFRGTKRFGLDGGESLIPLMEQIIKRGAQLGLEELVLGMAHRGRLNVLANIMDMPYRRIFAEFHGISQAAEIANSSGDVKYHLGASGDRVFDGKTVHLSLNANPSHLECVNTVVLGKVRAKQDQRNDKEQKKVMGLLLHGDAAFIGQGIVAETFLLSQLDGYKTGGTIHICINNQIGFTTAPAKSRSSPYPTDMAKTIDAPVFHVNGDDPEACVHVAKLAMEYRQKFHKDVVIDMWCYRRHGHNEGDEPMFTQPKMYTKIKAHPRSREVYAAKLENIEAINKGEAQQVVDHFISELDTEFEASTSFKSNKADWLEGQWSGLEVAGESEKRKGQTGVSMDLLKEIGYGLSNVPQNFAVNSKIKRQMDLRRQMIETGKNIDWGMAEALAYGTLMCQSTAVRLSGEDCERGTFSHRHSVLTDQDTEDRYIPLNHLRVGQAHFEVIDSPLSEFGLLGFEYGYATAEPHALVIWEAQFGDFANGAQVIIDQFISSGESKWLRMCGLVMLLPHGYEGQGPEHSSARLERYLQSSAEDNWQVCNITTPANFFHVLRRQIRRNFRKPLVVMSPKSLLRHKLCVSDIEDFGEDRSFHRVLVDHADLGGTLAKDKDIKRVVLCSGKVYFDLRERRDALNSKNIFLMRLEQLYPFPEKTIARILARFPNAEIAWCQEEPENMGAWDFVCRRLEKILISMNHKPNTHVTYIGRDAAASPATGNARQHKEQQQKLVEDALTL